MATVAQGDDLFVRKRRRSARALVLRRARGNLDGGLSAVDAERRHRRHELLRDTLDRQALLTVYQPIVDLRSGAAVGAEALTRFPDDPGRPPDRWFAEAAELGLGTQLELAALRSALGQLHRMPPGWYLSLNASPLTMMSVELRDAVADVCAERIVLELTEHSEVRDYEAFGRALGELRSRGVRLAVDDAGAGFASFRHILNLRPDVIKIDISLTRGIDSDAARRALGSALLSFGFEAYRAAIVAEGIETPGELATLRELGCHYGQGFYLGHPGGLPSPPSAVAPGATPGAPNVARPPFVAVAASSSRSPWPAPSPRLDGSR